MLPALPSEVTANADSLREFAAQMLPMEREQFFVMLHAWLTVQLHELLNETEAD